MKNIIMAVLLIVLMSGVVSAAQIGEWPHGERNVAPEGIEYAYYDFEEGSNCGDFDNQHPNVATFQVVVRDADDEWGTDYPSYGRIGGSMCGNARCYMNIFPYDNGQDWIYVVNGNVGFNPVCGPNDYFNGLYPGHAALIECKDDTTYVSFLVSTGGRFTVGIFDSRGNRLSYEIMYTNILREGDNASDFTEYHFHSPDGNIAYIELYGPFNGWHMDDLIIGGAPGYLSGDINTRVDYSWAAENMEELVGAQYFEYGIGYNLYTGEYYTAEEIKTIPLSYIDRGVRPYDVDWDIGIDNPGAILWAYNLESDSVKWYGLDNQMRHDFTEHVDYEDTQAGDVGFIDYAEYDEDTGLYGPGDGYIDEAFIVINPKADTTGDIVDCIRITPEAGVYYSTTEFINAHYDSSPGTVDYRSLKDKLNGGHSPHPKVKSKPI